MKCSRLKTFLCLLVLAVILIFFLHTLLRVNEGNRLNPKRQEYSENDFDFDEAEANFPKIINLRIQSKQKSQNFQVDGDQVVVAPYLQNVTKTFKKFIKPTKNNANHQPTTSSYKQRMENWNAFFRKRSKLQRAQTSDTVQNSINITSKRYKFPNSRKPLNISDFTAEPKWEFGDYYTLDTSSTQTSCPISVKIKALNSSWLKERFLPQITIFMDNRHFSDKEWERLKHFIPPYGWMTLNYTDIKEVVSALPRLPDQQILLSAKKADVPHCVSCAVVGNGGILNGSRLGKEIDLHDYVFRVNGAVTNGYETDVGNRTSFYGFTAQTLISALYLLSTEDFPNIPMTGETKYILFTEGQRDYGWLEALQKNKSISKGPLKAYSKSPREDFGSSFNLNKLLVAHPDFMRYLKDRYLRSETLKEKYWAIYRPSTGALLLLTAVHLCDTVSAYGFMTEDYKSYSDHYYDKNKTKTILYVNHDFLLEIELWRNLHRKNIIKLYQRT
uniref:alpha-N-acetylgalactosaminide alpha-2,6-sialyltransferase n=1 Tax=Leptobrachium leishanense TaxID=445787 RepID=A0A8C5MLV6_9ANUR